MKNSTRFVVLFLLAVVYAAPAAACQRCGLFGRQCKFFAPTYVAPYVAPIHYAAAPVYVVQNNYPPQSLVPPGTASYTATSSSYQQSVLPLLDANRYFSQQLELQKAASQTAALQSERALSVFQRVAELQAPAAERLAAGTAAQMVLTAAGLAQQSGGVSTQAVVISRDTQGRVQVTPLDPAASLAVRERVTTTQTVQKETLPPPPGGAGSLLEQFCYKCHGTQLAEPQGKFYLGDDAAVAKAMRAKWFDITNKVADHVMPPAKAPQPTDEQRRGILNELSQIINTYKEP